MDTHLPKYPYWLFCMKEEEKGWEPGKNIPVGTDVSRKYPGALRNALGPMVKAIKELRQTTNNCIGPYYIPKRYKKGIPELNSGRARPLETQEESRAFYD